MRVYHLINLAHASLFKATNRVLRQDEGVSAIQSAVLFILLSDDGQPASHIARELKMEKSSLTTLIDRMEKLNLVRREKCSTDGRVSNVFISDAGKSIASRVAKSTYQANKLLLSPFSPSDQKVIEQFLRYISDNSEKIIQSISANNDKQ